MHSKIPVGTLVPGARRGLGGYPGGGVIPL